MSFTNLFDVTNIGDPCQKGMLILVIPAIYQ